MVQRIGHHDRMSKNDWKHLRCGNGEGRSMKNAVACLSLVQEVQGLIPGRVVNFHLKTFNLGARRGGDVHFLIARLYIRGLD